MARPSESACTRETFMADTGCLKNFDAHERKVLALYFNILELAALGGTSYVGELDNGDLVEDAACLNTLDPNDKELGYLLVQRNNADDAGATIPATQDTLSQAIACLKLQPMAMIDAMTLLVQCQLGRHAAYPQVNL